MLKLASWIIIIYIYYLPARQARKFFIRIDADEVYNEVETCCRALSERFVTFLNKLNLLRENMSFVRNYAVGEGFGFFYDKLFVLTFI